MFYKMNRLLQRWMQMIKERLLKFKVETTKFKERRIKLNFKMNPLSA